VEPPPDEGTRPDSAVNKDEDSKSDSTVVNVRDGVARTSHSKGSQSQRNKCKGSDTDTTTSELDLRNESRRMTLRCRRPKDLALNSRGGVANLVQKFESPKIGEHKLCDQILPLLMSNKSQARARLPKIQVKKFLRLMLFPSDLLSEEEKAKLFVQQ